LAQRLQRNSKTFPRKNMRNLKAYVLAAILLPLSASAQAPAGNLAYIVTFHPGTTLPLRTAVLQGAGAVVRFNYTVIDAAAISIPSTSILTLLQANPTVAGITPDRPVFAIQLPPINPLPGGSQVIPAGVQRVGRPTASSHGEGIGVAIVDTGIDFAHRDLAPASASFSAFGISCQDDHGHGTHVAGISTALDNAFDVVGVAPKAKPYCVKVLNAAGSGSDSDVIAGLDWIFQNHAVVAPRIRVVNMSLGRTGTLDDSPPMRQAFQALHSLGIVVVVAAGNDENSEVRQMVPATYPEAIAVASTSALAGSSSCLLSPGAIAADTASFFTTDGRFNPATRIGVTVSAPGEDREDVNPACLITSSGILSTRMGGGTTRMSGTSMAAPHVAGIVARLMQAQNLAGVENIRGHLRATANRVGIAPLDSPTSGYTFDGEREGVARVQ
jgi:subtilisin family serine protease